MAYEATPFSDNRNIGSIVSDLKESISTLVSKEISLAKLEGKEAGKKITKLVSVGVVSLVALNSVIFFLMGGLTVLLVDIFTDMNIPNAFWIAPLVAAAIFVAVLGAVAMKFIPKDKATHDFEEKSYSPSRSEEEKWMQGYPIAHN